MVERTILATLPGSAPYQRLQVGLARGHDGRLVIDLREQHHAEGIGWFDQRALSLDPRQFKQLQAVLGMAADPAPAVIAEDGPTILPFPGPRDSETSRPAVGGEG